jgi:hypothetical protein
MTPEDRRGVVVSLAKQFKLTAAQIQSVAPNRGGCYASDRIVVDGLRVGFMYRETPDFDVDSGWRFMAGSETQDYLDDPNHLGIYDVNTVANYDPDIIAFLDAPINSAFERDQQFGVFVEVGYSPLDED